MASLTLLILSLGSSVIGTSGAHSTSAPSATTAVFPTPVRHVVVIFMENANASWVLADGSYQRYLAQQDAYASQFYAIKHGSNPNYFAATSGNTWTTLKEYSTVNLADLTAAVGQTWANFEQSMPKPCDAIPPSKTAAYNSGHNPFVWYSDVYSPASYCDSHDVGFGPLVSDLQNGTMPNYALVVANQTNDAHNLCAGPVGTTTVSCGDAWLRSFLSPILNSSASWVRSTAFLITYDEANLSDTRGINGSTGGGIVYTAAVGDCATPHLTVSTPYTTFSLLTTTEWLLGLGHTGHHDSWSTYPPIMSLFNNPLCGAAATSYSLTTSASPAAGGTVAPPSGMYVDGSSVTLSESPAVGYAFGGWTGTGTGSYTGNAANPTVTISSNITELARFVPSYAVSFDESGLPTGTSWSATLGGSTLSSTTSTIHFSESNGTYAYSIGLVSGYTASPSSGTITVLGGPETLTVTFTPGPPSITSFAAVPSSVTLGGGTVFEVVAVGGEGTLSYSYSSLPPGCATLDTASLGCTPTSSGTFRVEVAVSDSLGRSAFANASLTVNPSGGGPLTVAAPVISPNPSNVKALTSFSVVASGGSPPYKYAWHEYVKGIPNPGNVASFTGTPTSQGTWSITCTVTDSVGASATSPATSFKVLAAGAAVAAKSAAGAPRPATGSNLDLSGSLHASRSTVPAPEAPASVDGVASWTGAPVAPLPPVRSGTP